MVTYSFTLCHLCKELTELFMGRDSCRYHEDGTLVGETISGRRLTLSPDGRLLSLEQADSGYYFLMEVVEVAEMCGAEQVEVRSPISYQKVDLSAFKQASLERHLALEQLDRLERMIESAYQDALGPIVQIEKQLAPRRRRRERPTPKT